MAIYHIVLFKLKSGVTAEQISDLKREGHAMVGVIPGLQKVEFGPPLPATSHRSKGYDFGLVAILDKADDVIVYGDHPAHLKVHKLREALCDDSQGTLAYDLEFSA